jgi:carbamoyl-phosphate synthase large subunit
VHAVRAIQKKGIKAIIINNNPETVSTDYSTSDRLYFEPLTPSFVSRIVENEKQGLVGVIASFGGQTAINLAKPLEDMGITILGTSAKAIDMAEDREQTGEIMSKLGYIMPKWDITFKKSEVLSKCKRVGFPVLVRPSFVLGGEGMRIIYSESEVESYLQDYFKKIETFEKPLLIDKFLDDAVEVDVDFISDGTKTYCFIMEQLDKAGIHSGDSASVFPSQSLTREIMDKLVEMAQKIAKKFQVIGIGNLQCAIKNNEIFIIEVNPRASRTVPFVSKCLGFSLAELATNVILGDALPEFDFDLDYYKNPRYTESLKQEVVYKEQPIRHIAPKFVGIKWPVFCTHKLPGVSPELGPLMKSTGEAMTVGMTFEEAKKKWELTSSRSNNPEDYKGVEVYKL